MTTSEAKRRQFTEGKVTQLLFSFDTCTYLLAIYATDEANGKNSTFTIN